MAPHVKSQQDLVRLQSILSQLRLTAKDMKQVETDFQNAREKVQTASEKLIAQIGKMRDTFLDQLNDAEKHFRTHIEEVLKELSAAAWQGDSFTPVDSFAALFLKHRPGRSSNIVLKFNVEAIKRKWTGFLT